MKIFLLPLAARLGLAASLLVLAACKKDQNTGVSTLLPDAITFTQAGLYPEGTQYDAQRGRFLVSSQTAGRIGQVDDQGNYSAFADDIQLISTIGLNLDASRNRLLAAVSDPGYNKDRTGATTMGKLAAAAIINRSTGTLLQFLNLGAVAPATYSAHFANDIAIDGQGNAYVTDSFAPIIYKIVFDATGKGTASVFLADNAFQAPAGKFGLNGIVYHPSGYLVVAKSDEGKLLKIPINNGSPGTPTTVALPTGLDLSGDDGLQLRDNTNLLVVCNAQGKVYKVTTTNDFGSVALAGTFDTRTGGVSPYPTTLARRTASGPGVVSPVDSSYVLYSHLNALQAGQSPPVSDFMLKKVRL